jgi:hypothetical protein
MIATMEPLNASFCLTDPDDTRYQYVITLRKRYGDFLRKASVSLRQQGEENTVDAVHMLVSVLIRFGNKMFDWHKDQGDPYLHAWIRRQQR